MPTLDDSFPALTSALLERYGRPRPVSSADDPLEALVGGLLGRSLDPKKASAAVAALAEAGLLAAEPLAGADPGELADILREAGVSMPARGLGPLRRLARWFAERSSAGDLADEAISTTSLRDELIAIPGIGPATADALLLFGLGRASYPVDRASYRILARHGWLDPSADYEEARSLIEAQRPEDPSGLAELSAWFDRLGREFCRASVAKCERCPLRPLLPPGGPRQPGE